MSGTEASAGSAHLRNSSVLQWQHAGGTKQKQAGPGHEGRSPGRAPAESGLKLMDSPEAVDGEARPCLDTGKGARLIDFRQVKSEEVRQAERMLYDFKRVMMTKPKAVAM